MEKILLRTMIGFLGIMVPLGIVWFVVAEQISTARAQAE